MKPNAAQQRQATPATPTPAEPAHPMPAVQAGGALAALDGPIPEHLRQGAGRGNESVPVEDVAIPRLEIVQALSPIRKENPNAIEGLLYNSVTGFIYGTEALVVPVMYAKQWLIWKDRKKGGGFRGACKTQTEAAERLEQVVAEEGARKEDFTIAETPTHLCLLLKDDGRTEQIAIAMPRSKMKVNKKWNAAIQIAGGDRFSRVYKIRTVEDKNAAGEAYFNFAINPAAYVNQAIYREAEQLWERVSASGMTVNHESAAGEDSPSDDTDI